MFCHNCGKEVIDGAKFCRYCGAEIPEQTLRHARPEPEEIYSHSDMNEHTGFDVTPLGVDQQDADDISDRTRVYDFGRFEDNRVPGQEPYDDREIINDSFDEYTEEENPYDDRLDEYFREENILEKKNTWLWVVLGVVIAILIIAIGFIAVRAITQNTNKNNKPTVSTVATVPATQKPTEKPTEPPTQAPQPTQAPVTEAPAPTDPPAPEPTDPPAPVPTDPPAPTETPVPGYETEAEYVEYY